MTSFQKSQTSDGSGDGVPAPHGNSGNPPPSSLPEDRLRELLESEFNAFTITRPDLSALLDQLSEARATVERLTGAWSEVDRLTSANQASHTALLSSRAENEGLRKALEGARALHLGFTARPDRNQADAYYAFVKGADGIWANVYEALARTALQPEGV